MIHIYHFKDKNIVIDVESGAVHLVSPLAFLILEKAIYLEKTDEADIAENIKSPEISTSSKANCDIHKQADLCDGCLPGQDNYYKELLLRAANEIMVENNAEELLVATGELASLIDEGTLFSENTIDIGFFVDSEMIVKALCLHIAHDCNMACAYCFGDKGAFMGKREMMSLDVAKMAIDFLLENSGNRHNLEIDFFGGEPLMNFEVIKETVYYARKKEAELEKAGRNKHIRFTLTTNGLLLYDEKIDFINEHMANVIISIDGRKETNDRLRKTANGQGTYLLIIKRLLHFKDRRESNEDETKRLYYVRGTYTKYNLDFYEDIRHLYDLGFKNISVEPAVVDANKPYALTKDELSELFIQYEKLADAIEEKRAHSEEINFFHFNIDLEGGPCEIKRASGCGAGLDYMAVAPNGDVYPCHQFVGEDDKKLGNIGNLSQISKQTNKLQEYFKTANVLNKPACKDCFAKYYCGGGCHANAIHQNKDIMKPYEIGCELQRKRVELGIGIFASGSGS